MTAHINNNIFFQLQNELAFPKLIMVTLQSCSVFKVRQGWGGDCAYYHIHIMQVSHPSMYPVKHIYANANQKKVSIWTLMSLIKWSEICINTSYTPSFFHAYIYIYIVMMSFVPWNSGNRIFCINTSYTPSFFHAYIHIVMTSFVPCNSGSRMSSSCTVQLQGHQDISQDDACCHLDISTIYKLEFMTWSEKSRWQIH